MSKRTSAKDPAERKKLEEQAEQVPRDVNRTVRITLEIVVLLSMVVFCTFVWDGTIAVTPQLRYGTYGFLIALGIGIVVAIAWRWLHKRLVFGKYTVEGLLTQRAQELRVHELALREARAQGEQTGRDAAEKKLAGQHRELTQRLERTEKTLATAEPKARLWDEHGAAAQAARAQAERTAAEAEATRLESVRALERARAAEATATRHLNIERNRRRQRVLRSLRLRTRVSRTVAENSRLQVDLAAAQRSIKEGAGAVERETASLRETIADRERTIVDCRAAEVTLRGDLATAQGSSADAWNQIGEYERRATAAQELLVRAIQVLEQILKLKKPERFLATGKTTHQIAERFEALVKGLAVEVDRLVREARAEVLEQRREVQQRLEQRVSELRSTNQTLELDKKALAGYLEQRDREIARLTAREKDLSGEISLLREAAASRASSTPLVVSAMETLSVALAADDLEAAFVALTALGLQYDEASNAWTGENLAAVQQALIVIGYPAAQLVAQYLKRAEEAAGKFDIDEADDDQVASLERAQLLGDALTEFVAGAVSRYSAVDWLLSLPPAERKAVVNAKQASDWFVMLVIASYLVGRRKCRFILETDAYHQVRDKLSSNLVACIGSTLRAEQHRSERATDRVTKLRIATMFYSDAVLRAVKRAGTLVGLHAAGEGGVSNDPHNWSLWLSVVANPPDAATSELFAAARKSLMALWCLSPTELRELLIDAIGDGAHDAIREKRPDGRKPIAGSAAAEMGFDPTFALAFAPTSRAEWSAVGSRASIYSLIELSSLSHPSRGLGGKRVNKAFDPYQAVALEWMYAHNNDPGDKLSPHMRTQTLRIPEENAKRVSNLGAQFFSPFAAARRERVRVMSL